MTKTELVANIRRDRAALDALLGEIDDARTLEPSLDAGWSVKDVLAHISAWERACTGWLETVARGATPERPEVRDVDATNAGYYERAKDAPLAEVAAESAASYDALLAAVERLSDADLDDETRFGFPMWRMIDGNSGEHYREHIEQIGAWLERPR
jgi:hypothetical protein